MSTGDKNSTFSKNLRSSSIPPNTPRPRAADEKLPSTGTIAALNDGKGDMGDNKSEDRVKEYVTFTKSVQSQLAVMSLEFDQKLAQVQKANSEAISKIEQVSKEAQANNLTNFEHMLSKMGELMKIVSDSATKTVSMVDSLKNHQVTLPEKVTGLDYPC